MAISWNWKSANSNSKSGWDKDKSRIRKVVWYMRIGAIEWREYLISYVILILIFVCRCPRPSLLLLLQLFVTVAIPVSVFYIGIIIIVSGTHIIILVRYLELFGLYGCLICNWVVCIKRQVHLGIKGNFPQTTIIAGYDNVQPAHNKTKNWKHVTVLMRFWQFYANHPILSRCDTE